MSVRGSASLASYLAEIRGFPALSLAEERRLAERIRSGGDPRAAHQLVSANLRLVVRLARGYMGYGFALADLVQEGNVGLLQAVRRFDPQRNVRLVTYASFWIRAFILAYVLRGWSPVRLGTTPAQRRLFFGLERVRRCLQQARTVDPGGAGDEAERIAAELALKVSEVREMQMRLSGRPLSIDAPATDGRRGPLGSLLADTALLQDEALAAAEERRNLASEVDVALARLRPRDRFIIEARLLRDPPLTLKDVGRRLAVSAERAGQLEARARCFLRERLRRADRREGKGPAACGARGWPLAPDGRG